jgi:hypothetical protein
MNDVAQDLRYALRRLALTPGFTLLALVTLALGIGANTALYSVLYAVLLKPLPFSEPERLYWVYSRHTSTDRYPFSLPEFCDYRDRTRTLEGFAGFTELEREPGGDEHTERIPGLRVSANLFDRAGRSRRRSGAPSVPRDDIPGNEKVVVLSHGLWQRRFGGDPKVVGRAAHAERRVLHRGRRDGPGLPVPDPRHRPRDPARSGPGPVALRPRVHQLHPRGRARPPGHEPRAGDGRARRHRPAAPGGVPGQLRAEERRAGRSLPRGAHPQLQRGAVDAGGGRGAAAADRLRQPREPDAGAGDGPPPGAGDPAGARRPPGAARATAAARERAPGPRRGARRSAARLLGRAAARRDEPDGHAEGPGDRSQRPRAALRDHGGPFSPGSGSGWRRRCAPSAWTRTRT